MKQKIYILAVIIFSSITSFGQNNSEQADQIILKLKNEAVTGKTLCSGKSIGNVKIDNVTQKFKAVKIKKQSTGKKNGRHIYVIRFPEGTNLQQVIDEYYKTGEIEYAEPDFKGAGDGVQGTVPNDQYYFRQWGLKNDGTFSLTPAVAGADIDMERAWDIEQGDSNIIVAIIDGGAKLDHPELASRIWTNYSETDSNGIDDDGNGYIDDVTGWDFVNDDNNPTDDYGHGTNIAGIIGANANNSIGYAGINWKSKLMLLKGLNSTNGGNITWWTNAIYYAVDNGARVISMSLSAPTISIPLQDAVNYALNNNVVIVASMGNLNSGVARYPSGFPGVIAVGATSSNDTRASPFYGGSTSGSNYGSHISVVAPGNVTYGLSYQSNTNYGIYFSGTSQAVPHVTGLVSLLLSRDSTRTPSQIKSIIETTAEDQVGNPVEDTPGWDQYYGHGRINAFNALSSTGINSWDAQNQNFSVFPNPADQNFTVGFPLEAKQIQIFNSLGQSVQIKNVNNQTTQNFQLADEGMYFIQITTDKQITSKKLIISGNR